MRKMTSQDNQLFRLTTWFCCDDVWYVEFLDENRDVVDNMRYTDFDQVQVDAKNWNNYLVDEPGGVVKRVAFNSP